MAPRTSITTAAIIITTRPAHAATGIRERKKVTEMLGVDWRCLCVLGISIVRLDGRDLRLQKSE